MLKTLGRLLQTFRHRTDPLSERVDWSYIDGTGFVHAEMSTQIPCARLPVNDPSIIELGMGMPFHVCHERFAPLGRAQEELRMEEEESAVAEKEWKGEIRGDPRQSWLQPRSVEDGEGMEGRDMTEWCCWQSSDMEVECEYLARGRCEVCFFLFHLEKSAGGLDLCPFHHRGERPVWAASQEQWRQCWKS
jgi:hypothetical protein